MRAQMMNQPLLISQQIEFAARFHGSVEVVTRASPRSSALQADGHVSARSRARGAGSGRTPSHDGCQVFLTLKPCQVILTE